MPIPSEQRLTRLCSIVLAAWGLLLVISIPYQRPHIDEAWLGEQSYFFAHDGAIRSEIYRGYAHQDEVILVTHKLFIVLGGLSVRLLGWGLAQLRLLSLLSGLFVLILIGRHLRTRDPDHPLLSSRIAPLALLAMPLFFKFTNYFRPEVMLAAAGFASYHLLSRYLDDVKQRYLIGSALVAGIAVLVHLNGVIFILAAIVVLALNRRPRAAVLFATIAGAIAALYFADTLGRWDLFRQQLAAVPSLEPKDFRWDAPFWRLLDEHKRLFRKPEIIFTTSLFFGAFAYQWFHQCPARRRLLAYTIVAMIGLGAFGQAKTTPYAIALFPLFAIVIAQATSSWLTNYRRTKAAVSIVGIVLWAAFALHSLAADTILATTEKFDIVRANQKTAAVIPTARTVLAPMEFIFNEIEHRPIRAIKAVELLDSCSDENPLTLHQLWTYADSAGIRAIILDRERRDRMGLTNAAPDDTANGFRVAASFPDFGRIVLTKSETLNRAP